jgi:hypothetical protein
MPPTIESGAEEAHGSAGQVAPPPVDARPSCSAPAAWQVPDRRRWWAVLAALFFGLLAVYLANGARFQGADTLGSCYSALALLRGRGFSLDRMVGQLGPGYWYHRGVRGYLSVYGFAPPLLALPVYEVFDKLVFFGHWTEDRLLIVGKVAAALMTAGAATLLAICARRFLPALGSVVIALVFGLCSPAWTISSQALWRHSPAGMLSAAALAFVLWPREVRPSMPLLALGGLAAGLAVWCRENLALGALAAVVYLWCARGRRAALGFAAGGALSAVGLLALNLHYWGQAFSTGAYALGQRMAQQQGVAMWDTPVWRGLLGLLVSPSRGFFVYCPVFLASVWGAVRGGRAPERAGWLFLSFAALAAFGVFTRWHWWWAGATYGPRYVLDAVPFATLLIIPAWPALTATRARIIGFTTAAAFSALVQLAGAVHYDGKAWDEPPGAPSVDAQPARVWRWSDSQLLFYLRWPDTHPDRLRWR